MEKQAVQYRSMIKFTGVFLIPAMLACSLLFTGFHEVNLTGMLNDPAWGMTAKVSAVMMLAWLLLMLALIAKGTERYLKLRLCVLAILIIAALFIPYSNEESILSGFHIAISYAAFIWMNLLFFRYCRFYTNERNIYVCVSVFAFMLSLTTGMVTGISEIVYGIACSILLTLIALKNL